MVVEQASSFIKPAGVGRSDETELLAVEMVAELVAKRAEESSEGSHPLADGGAHPNPNLKCFRRVIAEQLGSPTAFADAEGMLEWDGIGGWRGTAHERELRCLTWPQLRTLADCGWEIP